MKTSLIALLLAPLLLTSTTPAMAAPPALTVTTPVLNLHRDLVIVGTATDTAETDAVDGRVALAGIKEVRYQVEGSKKWRKAQLTAKNASSTGWMINFDNKSAAGKRILFYAVDRSGFGSAINSTRFKRSSTTGTATTTPTPTPTPTTNNGTNVTFGN